MLTLRSPRLLALPLILMMTASCGKWARSKVDQSIDTVPIPAFPKVQDDVFSLSGVKPEITYRTTLLWINQQTDPALLAEVVNASVFSREAFAAARNFEITNNFVDLYGYRNLYGDNGLDVQALSFMQKDLRNFELQALEKNPLSAEQKALNAKGWIESEVASLNLSPEQKTSFDAAWGAYCEAKIIELASNATFASSTYKGLPSPQPLCANYYEAQAMLTGPACTDVSDGNYFLCLWQEGVLKTRWFQPLPAPEATAGSEEVASNSAFNTEMESKRTDLTNLLTPDPSNFQKVIALNPEKVSIQADPVRNKINANFFVSMFTQQLVKESGNNVAWCSIPTFGIKDATLRPICTLFGLARLPESPAQWIDSMEARIQGTSSLVALPPPSGRTATTQQVIQFVAERNRGKTSESDRLFHQVASSPKPLDLPTYEGAGPEFVNALGEIRSLLAPVLYGTFSAEDQKERELRLQNISYRASKIESSRAALKVLQDQSNLSIDRGLKATNAGDVAFGFIEIRFHFRQLGQVLLGEFWPKDAEVSNRPSHIFRGCYDVGSQSSIDCPSEIPGEAEGLTVYPATLSRDPESGRIDLAMVVSDPEAVSLVNKPRVDTSTGALPNYFLDFDAEVFRNRTLRFEIYPNRLDEYLDIMTGKAFINDGSQDLFEGGISGWELWGF